jgi:NAD(P)H-flavin reductase/ferredoxin
MSGYEVTLVFEDGRSVRIDADESDTIYIAALKNRVRIETDCREGACATCKGLCTQGDYYMDDYTDEALTDDEAARREVLTCQMHVTSDCVIELPYDSAIAMKGEPDSRPGRVAGIERVSSTVTRLVVTLRDDDAAMNFLPGQYVHLGVPGTDAQRSYSFANPPPTEGADGESAGSLEFFIKLLDDGVMSDYLSARAKVGDDMAVTGPFGRFYLRPPTRPIVMVAGGTGLAPMLSMFGAMIDGGATGQPVHLLYGANTPDEMFALDRLDAVREAGIGLTVETCVVEPGDGWDGATGHVTSLLRPEIINGGDCDVYLCGPPPMIEAAETWLRDHQIDPARVHAEKFLAS